MIEIAVVKSVSRQTFRYSLDRRDENDHRAQITVRLSSQPFRDRQYPLQAFSPKGCRSSRREVPKKLFLILEEGTRDRSKEFRPSLLIRCHVDFEEGVIHHAQFRVSLKLLHDAPQLAGQPIVVRIQQRDDFSACPCETKIESGALAPIRLVEILYARTILFDALGSVVGRAV